MVQTLWTVCDLQRNFMQAEFLQRDFHKHLEKYIGESVYEEDNIFKSVESRSKVKEKRDIDDILHSAFHGNRVRGDFGQECR